MTGRSKGLTCLLASSWRREAGSLHHGEGQSFGGLGDSRPSLVGAARAEPRAFPRGSASAVQKATSHQCGALVTVGSALQPWLMGAFQTSHPSQGQETPSPGPCHEPNTLLSPGTHAASVGIGTSVFLGGLGGSGSAGGKPWGSVTS